MNKYTILGRKPGDESKTIIGECYSEYYADIWVDIAREEGFIEIEILIDEDW
jgi:hypothetical protein